MKTIAKTQCKTLTHAKPPKAILGAVETLSWRPRQLLQCLQEVPDDGKGCSKGYMYLLGKLGTNGPRFTKLGG